MNVEKDQTREQPEEFPSRETGGLRGQKPRIGFLLIGHPDYPNDVGRTMLRSASEGLRKLGCEPVVQRQPLLSRAAARAAAEALIEEHPDGVVVFLGTWIEAPVAFAAIREIEHLPLAVWGFPQYVDRSGNLDSTGSLVALTVVKATLERMGFSFTWIAGLPGDQDAVEKAARFARVAMTLRALRHSALGLIGYASMGMYPGTFDHASLRRWIGPEVIHVDTSTLLRRMEGLPAEEGEKAIREMRKTAAFEEGVPPGLLEKAGRMTAALESLARDEELDAIDLKCQYELSQEFGCTGCVALSSLADKGLVCGCEGDVPTTVTQMILSLLSGKVTMYGDLLDWDENGNVLISPCGFAPFSLCADSPTLRRHTHPGFRGLLTSSVLKKGTITLARLGETAEGYRLQVLVGKTVPTELRQGIFPAIKLNIRESRAEIIQGMTSQHFALCYGSLRSDLRELCRWLNLEYVGR